jgi:predicted  nucleic acid-binding Zn-ribbon protein
MDKDKILAELDSASREMHILSMQVMRLVDEIDPTWRKRMERIRKKNLEGFQI